MSVAEQKKNARSTRTDVLLRPRPTQEAVTERINQWALWKLGGGGRPNLHGKLVEGHTAKMHYVACPKYKSIAGSWKRAFSERRELGGSDFPDFEGFRCKAEELSAFALLFASRGNVFKVRAHHFSGSNPQTTCASYFPTERGINYFDCSRG